MFWQRRARKSKGPQLIVFRFKVPFIVHVSLAAYNELIFHSNPLICISCSKFTFCFADDDSGIDSEDDEDVYIETAITPCKNYELIDNFKAWLQSVDGREKSERCAAQNSRQVLSIINAIQSENSIFTFENIFNRQLVRDKWLTPLDKLRRPGTIKSYLCSLKMFFKYLLCDRPTQIEFSDSACITIITIIENWLSSYRKKISIRKWRKQMEDLQKLIMPDELNKFDSSDVVVGSIKIINCSASSKDAVSFKNFTQSRDYLLTSLILNNGSRAGAIANMTLREFNMAIVESQGYVVSVLQHKTVSSAGPADLALTDDLYRLLNLYVHKIRNKLSGIDVRDTSKVFVSWTGKSMSSSMICDQLNSFWKEAVGKSVFRDRLTSTLVRKSCVSTVHEVCPSLKTDLASLMKHSEKQASETYKLRNNIKVAALTSQKLQQLMRGKNDDTEVIQNVFCSEIQKGSVSTEDVRSKMETEPTVSKYNEKQLLDRVRYMIGKSANATDIHNEDNRKAYTTEYVAKTSFDAATTVSDNYSLPSTTSSIRTRTKFTNEDVKLILTELSSLIANSYPDTGARLRAMCKENQQLHRLMDNFGEKCILMKIRNERKKKK